jgi:acyl-CoA thioesterase FadM
MTMTVSSPPATVLSCRPGFEGANIRTWIGFKHFMYLVEQAALQWLIDRGTSARDLFLDYGLGFEIVDCSAQLPAVLEIDDQVTAQVTGEGPVLAVQLSVDRDGRPVTVLRGKLRVALVPEPAAPVHRPAPPALAALEVPHLAAASTVKDPGTGWEPEEFLWSWRAPYFYCHYSDRVQHSGFVRCLEEVVDRFLADRGISVGRMLRERSWIPVVSRARVQLIEPAHMEETVHTTFTVTDILRGVMFDGRMDCYVKRGDQVVPVATAKILHGYAIAAGEGAGGLAELDADVVTALTGEALTGEALTGGAR